MKTNSCQIISLILLAYFLYIFLIGFVFLFYFIFLIFCFLLRHFSSLPLFVFIFYKLFTFFRNPLFTRYFPSFPLIFHFLYNSLFYLYLASSLFIYLFFIPSYWLNDYIFLYLQFSLSSYIFTSFPLLTFLLPLGNCFPFSSLSSSLLPIPRFIFIWTNYSFSIPLLFTIIP